MIAVRRRRSSTVASTTVRTPVASPSSAIPEMSASVKLLTASRARRKAMIVPTPR